MLAFYRDSFVAVADTAKTLIDQMRAGAGPAFLELVTYRWYGHVDWRDDIDVGVNRSLDNVQNWRARDPVARLSKAMIAAGTWSREQEDDYCAALDEQIAAAWEKAMNDPWPDGSATLDRVYASPGDAGTGT